MFEQMEWRTAYGIWKTGGYPFAKSLDSPVSAETIYVEYKRDGFIYGYDWLENAQAQERKRQIEKNPNAFLYFAQSTNKGTMQTAEMLVESRDEEELAAVWIAATTKELSEFSPGNGVGHYANMFHRAAWEFLKNRFHMWHHAMKKLVPEIMIPSSVLENIRCKDAESVMGLIQMNTVLLKSAWSILRYSSLKDGESPACSYRISAK